MGSSHVRVAKYPGFLEWAKKGQIDVNPQTAKEFIKIIKEIYYPSTEKFQSLLKEQK